MAGLSNKSRVEALEGTFLGFNRPLYLRILGGAGATAGMCMNDNGTFPAGLAEISGGGYAPLLVTGDPNPALSAWGVSVAGPPSQKQVPKVGGPPIVFTAVAATWENVCAYAWTTDASPISATNYVSGDPLANAGVPVVQTIAPGKSLVFDEAQGNAICERLGGAPIGVNPT